MNNGVLIGSVLSTVIMLISNVYFYIPFWTSKGKYKVYSTACESKCGKDKYELVDFNNLCVCKNGKTYTRDLNKLYK